MLRRNHLDRIQVAFDDHRLVDNAGLLLPATLALHPGLSQLVQQRLGLGDAPARANTARGAAHFLPETVGRVRYAGARGGLTVRADSGFYAHGAASVCRKMDARFSIAIRQHKSLHNVIEAIPEDAWTPIPHWMDGAADVAETTYIPFQSEPDAAPARLIVRRVKPTPGSQLALFATYSITASSPTAMGRCSNRRLIIAATPRSKMRYATSSTVSDWTTCRPAASPPTAPGWRCRRWRTTWPAGDSPHRPG